MIRGSRKVQVRRAHKMSVPWFVALLLASLALTSAELIISNSSNSDININYKIAIEWFDNAKAQLRSDDIFAPLALETDTLLSGTIVLVWEEDNRFTEMRSYVIRAQNEGALAIIIRSPDGDGTHSFSAFLSVSSDIFLPDPPRLNFNFFDTIEHPGRIMYQVTIGSTSDINIPVFSMLYSQFESLRENLPALARITPNGNENIPYDFANSAGVQFWYALVAAVNVAALVFACVRLAQNIIAKGFSRNIATISLSLNIFGFTISTIFWAANPDGYRRLWPVQLSTIFLTFPIPFVFSANLLVVLYWLEIMTAKKLAGMGSYLKRLRLPYFIFVGYLLFAELVTALLRIFIIAYWTTIISVINILLALLLIAITVFVVIREIKKAQLEGFVVNVRLERMNRYMTAMAALSVITVVSLALYVVFQYNTYGAHFSLGLIAILVCCVTINQINMFQRPGSSSSSSRSSSRGKSTSKDQNDAGITSHSSDEKMTSKS